jgi:lysozyme family protein
MAHLIAANAARWRAMRLRADRIAGFDVTARRLAGAKPRYQKIAAGLMAQGFYVPWWVIAVIHEREAGGPPHWDKQLGQGDPLSEVSRHDPAGRGPFFNHPSDPSGQDAFYRAALDALIDCPPHAARWKDWSAGGTLTLLEQYNGLGYAAHGVPSAYVWSGTDRYVSGKYVADHVYRSGVVDVQEGCAPIIARMMRLDPSVGFAPAAGPLPRQEPQRPGPRVKLEALKLLLRAIKRVFVR